ncbi:MAG TPA: ABC transporter ATP-binding protein [Candidatus Saccharimonadales bacterium]|nr:ABC transporter ATP-binding protein [Candidatus Saccharimonadales bacterium]
MSTTSVISAQNIDKSYGKGPNTFQALKNINLSIKPGESVAILGKSGSGKSTLMHLLALMDEPTSGAIYIEDQDVEKLSKKRQDLLRNRTFGFVFQQFFLNGNASVLENVILPLKIAGVGSRERKQRGIEALEAVELGDKRNNKASDLSGGQKQRVVIARALINNPQIIFADEPTGNLDSATGEKVEEILFGLNKSKGITLILVTHDPDLAARCDRQIHIKDGEIQGASA